MTWHHCNMDKKSHFLTKKHNMLHIGTEITKQILTQKRREKSKIFSSPDCQILNQVSSSINYFWYEGYALTGWLSGTVEPVL